MHASLRALMDGLVGYAGLFPPAELGLEAAVREYGAHLQSDDQWMLGDFIVPASRLTELTAWREVMAGGDRSWRFVVLPRGGDLDALESSLREDFAAMDDFEQAMEGRAGISGIEIRLPSSIAIESAATARWMDRLHSVVRERVLDVFVEPVRGTGWPEMLANTADVLSQVRTAIAGPNFGMKLRCGGVTADAFPSVDEVAEFIEVSRKFEVPFKATAGLHHPIRHHHAPLGVDMHGFVNVFAAALFASDGLLGDDLRALLAEPHASCFQWTDDRLSWKGHVIGTERIRELRAGQVANYGSCSFSEPCEDLRALGWL